MSYYVPGLGEKDPDKTIRSLMQAHEKTATNEANVATNTADIATNTADIATNTADIATNAASIAANASDISDLQTQTSGYESAWTAWTPTVTAGSGSFTTLGTVTARYKKIGKTVFFYIAIPITTNGTAATYVQATLPFTAANTSHQSAVGRENGLTGKSLGARIFVNTADLQFTFYDATYPGANGAIIGGSGIYETA